MKHMTKEEQDAWMELYLKEQQEMMANFDVDKIKRDETFGKVTDISVTWKDVSFSIKIPDPADPKGKKKD